MIFKVADAQKHTVSLVWSPPLEPNGILTGYLLEYQLSMSLSLSFSLTLNFAVVTHMVPPSS